MQTSENTPITSSVLRGYARGSPPSRRPRFFVDPQLVTVLVAHRFLGPGLRAGRHDIERRPLSASEIEAVLRVSISATIKTRVIYRSA
jgi:hypothetical protein